MAPRKSDLSPQRQHLLEVMQRTGYGSIENLSIRDGEPEFTGRTRVIRMIKLGGGDNGPRREHLLADTELKDGHIELFGVFRRIGNGVVCSLTLTAGLPRYLEVPEPPELQPHQGDRSSPTSAILPPTRVLQGMSAGTTPHRSPAA